MGMSENFDDLFRSPEDLEPVEDLTEGGSWLLELVAAVDFLGRGDRHGLTVWDALEEAMRWWSAEQHRLRGLFLAAIGAEQTRIEASFRQAIQIALEQKSISLAKRAEATYAGYRRQKLSKSGARGLRLPLC